jgi:hypothetical protein
MLKYFAVSYSARDMYRVEEDHTGGARRSALITNWEGYGRS